MKVAVVADGNSRNRVKMCWHLKGILYRVKKSGTAETKSFNVFVSLNQQRDGNVFLLKESDCYILEFERSFQK